MTPSRSTPIANRAQTSATGVISRSAILVATNEAPQTATANAALRSAPAFPELPGSTPAFTRAPKKRYDRG